MGRLLERTVDVMMDLILGLDLSTSIVGYTLIDLEGALHGISYITLKKETEHIDKLKIFIAEIEQYIPVVKYVGIEKALVMMGQRPDKYGNMKNSSTPSVIAKLNNFNGMCQSSCLHLYKTDPVLYNVATARKKAFPNLKFPTGADRKVMIRDEVQKMWPQIEWPVMMRGKNIGNPRKEACDMSDSAVIALAMLSDLRGGR